MAKIRYIGKKEEKSDNVAGTGLVWLGNGDVQEVDNPAAVAKLLRHPDVWELVEGEAVPVVQPEAKPVEPDDDDQSQFNVKPDLNSMDKAAMLDFAKTHYQLSIPKNTSEAKIRSTIIERMNRG